MEVLLWIGIALENATHSYFSPKSEKAQQVLWLYPSEHRAATKSIPSPPATTATCQGRVQSRASTATENSARNGSDIGGRAWQS